MSLQNLELAITGVGLWLPTEAEPKAPGELLDRRSKRRASPITLALAEVFGQAANQAQVDLATVSAVFGSALGQAHTMISLLDQMWREGTGLSPMMFATSVHNAAAGVVSIASKNRGFTTSLAADYDTPAMSLIEAAKLVATRNAPVVVACGDEA